MKRHFTVLAVFIAGLVMMSCSQDQMPGEIPPNVHVKTESGEAETVLGTYCWKNECVDKEGPPELLNGKEPVKVSPG